MRATLDHRALVSQERLGVQVLGATGQQVVTAVLWISPLRNTNWPTSCVKASRPTEVSSSIPRYVVTEEGIFRSDLSRFKNQPKLLAQGLDPGCFARELPGVSLGFTTSHLCTNAIFTRKRWANASTGLSTLEILSDWLTTRMTVLWTAKRCRCDRTASVCWVNPIWK